MMGELLNQASIIATSHRLRYGVRSFEGCVRNATLDTACIPILTERCCSTQQLPR